MSKIIDKLPDDVKESGRNMLKIMYVIAEECVNSMKMKEKSSERPLTREEAGIFMDEYIQLWLSFCNMPECITLIREIAINRYYTEKKDPFAV